MDKLAFEDPRDANGFVAYLKRKGFRRNPLQADRLEVHLVSACIPGNLNGYIDSAVEQVYAAIQCLGIFGVGCAYTWVDGDHALLHITDDVSGVAQVMEAYPAYEEGNSTVPNEPFKRLEVFEILSAMGFGHKPNMPDFSNPCSPGEVEALAERIRQEGVALRLVPQADGQVLLQLEGAQLDLLELLSQKHDRLVVLCG
jgi:hypothetical protein